MPKLHTFPTLFEDVLQVSISKLKIWGYLQPETIKNGTLTWSRNGNKTGCIAISSNTYEPKPYIELDYSYNNEPRNYKIYLTSTPSNLGKGLIWYFVCPNTGKRCRILYSIGGYFLHREAFKGCFYEKQTQSKFYRNLDKTLGAYFRTDKLYEQLHKKNFKKSYAGKPTKRYLKIIDKIDKYESIPYHEIERLMIK